MILKVCDTKTQYEFCGYNANYILSYVIEIVSKGTPIKIQHLRYLNEEYF